MMTYILIGWIAFAIFLVIDSDVKPNGTVEWIALVLSAIIATPIIMILMALQLIFIAVLLTLILSPLILIGLLTTHFIF